MDQLQNEWLFLLEQQPRQAMDVIFHNEWAVQKDGWHDMEEMIVGIMELYGDDYTLVRRVDEAILDWLVENWGRVYQNPDPSIGLLWQRVFMVIQGIEGLTCTAVFLEMVFEDSFAFLQPFSYCEKIDPLGQYLEAVARNQVDQDLLPRWLELCELPTKLQYFQAPAVLSGLTFVPVEGCSVTAMLELPIKGIIKLSESLNRLVNEGSINQLQADGVLEHLVLEDRPGEFPLLLVGPVTLGF